MISMKLHNKSHAGVRSVFLLSFHNRTKSPPTTSPVTIRSIGVRFFIIIDIHLLHCLFQWCIILLLRLSILGHIGNGNRRSLEAFPCGDDDEGDLGTWVCEESAFAFEVEEIVMFKRVDGSGKGEVKIT